MFDELFSKFRKKINKAEKTSEELEAEYEKLKLQYAQIANSDLYGFITAYYLAKIEINRDVMETKDPLVEADRFALVNLRAENRVMKYFMEDMEGMKAQMELEALQKEQAQQIL